MTWGGLHHCNIVLKLKRVVGTKPNSCCDILNLVSHMIMKYIYWNLLQSASMLHSFVSYMMSLAWTWRICSVRDQDCFILLSCIVYWPVSLFFLCASHQTLCRQAQCLAAAPPWTCRRPSWAPHRTPLAPTSWSSPPPPSSRWPAPITPTSTPTSTFSTPPPVSSAHSLGFSCVLIQCGSSYLLQHLLYFPF